jgi:ubiquinone biosynthesis monooxygenase Coq6
MADAECLAGHIQRSVQSGMGIKDNAGLQYALQQYESERQREVVSVMGGIQILHAAFGTTFSPAVHVRSVGMNIVNSIGPVRRKLVRVATGVDGIFEKK